MITKADIDHSRVTVESFPGLVEGDKSSFRELYRHFFRRVFGFVSKFTLTREDAEEITQDVFVKVWDKRSDLDSQKNLGGYLFTIAHNMVIDKLRHYAARENKLKQLIYKNLQTQSTEQLVNFYELSGIISQLVDKLPDRRRTIFKLSREQGLTNKKIADVLDISEGTVEKQMSKALATLKHRLKAVYGVLIEL